MPAAIRAALLILCLFAVPSVCGEEAPAPRQASLQDAIREAEADLRQTESSQTGPAQMGLGLSEIAGVLLLLAALGGMLYAVRRMRGGFSGGSASGEMKLVDRLPVSRQTTLLLVKVREKEYLLADNPNGVTLLDATTQKEQEEKT